MVVKEAKLGKLEYPKGEKIRRPLADGFRKADKLFLHIPPPYCGEGRRNRYLWIRDRDIRHLQYRVHWLRSCFLPPGGRWYPVLPKEERPNG